MIPNVETPVAFAAILPGSLLADAGIGPGAGLLAINSEVIAVQPGLEHERRDEPGRATDTGDPNRRPVLKLARELGVDVVAGQRGGHDVSRHRVVLGEFVHRRPDRRELLVGPSSEQQGGCLFLLTTLDLVGGRVEFDRVERPTGAAMVAAARRLHDAVEHLAREVLHQFGATNARHINESARDLATRDRSSTAEAARSRADRICNSAPDPVLTTPVNSLAFPRRATIPSGGAAVRRVLSSLAWSLIGFTVVIYGTR